MSYDDYVTWILEALLVKRRLGLSLENYRAYKSVQTLYLKPDKQLNRFL